MTGMILMVRRIILHQQARELRFPSEAERAWLALGSRMSLGMTVLASW